MINLDGYYLGTSHGEYGDSGSGIFSLDGRFIGMAVAKKKFSFSNLQTLPSINLGEVADHYADTKIISADGIFCLLGTDDTNVRCKYEKSKI